MATGQSKRIATLNTAIQDTLLWDLSTCPRPDSCSTPDHQQSWSEVVVRGRKSVLDGASSPPHTSLSNRYAVLPDDAPVHPADVSATANTVASPPPATSGVNRFTSGADPQIPPRETTTTSRRETSRSTIGPDCRSSSRGQMSASRRRILKDAVTRRSGGLLPGPAPAGRTSSSPGPDEAAPQQCSPVRTPPHTPASTLNT